ncbi:MAG: thiamine phosphate synthase [Rhizobiaceae bacterium]
MTDIPDRCRIVLILPPGLGARDAADRTAKALSGGDVASVIVPQYALDAAAFQEIAAAVAPVAQAAGAAVVVAGDSRVAGRIGADGLHVEGSLADLAETIDKHQAHMMIGATGGKTRDDALERGERRPDYIFFGRFGFDTVPDPHPRNLSLGQWWAEVIEVPCIVLAGSDVASVEAVAATGAEFVGLGNAVFADGVDPAEAVRGANEILDAAGPRFGG